MPLRLSQGHLLFSSFLRSFKLTHRLSLGLLSIATYLLLALQCVAQDAAQEQKFRDEAAKAGTDSTKSYGWTHSVVTGLNLTQISFKDWAQGGESALSYTLWLKGSAVEEQERTKWTNGYKLGFGQTRLGDQGLKKTDDEIYLEALLIYKLGLSINPYASATMRTQFARGYAYDATGNELAVSTFFDPGYLTQSVGAAYQPLPEVTTRFGIGLREIFTSDFVRYADDPETMEIEKTKVEGGIESVTDVKWKFAENMIVTSRLEMFAPFNHVDRIIVRSDNTISASVNKYVTTTLNVQLVNDVTVTPLTQIKEVVALGVTYTLF